ncbi:MAG: OmpH family outer membrane protein [bacterium]
MKKMIVLGVVILGLFLSPTYLIAQGSPGAHPEPSVTDTDITINPPAQSPMAVPQPQVAMKVGYVDVSRVFEEYKRTKRAKEDINRKIKDKEQTIRAMEKELRELRREFESQKSRLTEAEINEQERAIADKADRIQIFTDSAEEELSQQEAKMTEEILGEIYDEIYGVGEREHFSIIVDKNNIIYGAKTLDLTERILQALEKK